MSWPRELQQRELRGGPPSQPLPRPNAGVLVLAEEHTVGGLPGGLLSHVEGAIHYLDLAGVQARSLADFGASSELLGGISKLYASRSGLQSLDGLQHLAAVRYLYLDQNELSETELLRLPDVLPAGCRLEALDVLGNPGCTPAVEAALAASPLLQAAHFLNGRRLQR